MRWNTCFRLSLLSFCCLASLQWTCAAVTSATEPVTAQVEETTEGASPEKWEYPRMCYVEKSKVDELIVQMNSTVRVLNRDDEYLECGEKLKIVKADNMEICTEERIRRVQKDLFEVAGSLFKLAVRLKEPAEEEVRSLDLKKIRLIHDLYALHVFYGPSPCNSHSIALLPFGSLVEHLEWNLDQIFVLFQTTRPTRPPPPTTPAPSTTTSKPTAEDMLNPEKSFAELIEMAESNPSLMSKAVPKIVSQRYSRRVSTFDRLLDFVDAMPTTENKIFGFSAVYDEMHGHNQKPEKLQLEKLAVNVKHLLASAPTTLNVVAASKLDELAEDPDLNPLNFILSPQWSLQELTEMAQSNSSAMSKALPEIISQRYNASDSQFEALLNFGEGLPTTENKIIGFVTIHDEMHRHNQTTNLAELLKLTKKVTSLNEDIGQIPIFAKTATKLKWTNLIRDLTPLMLIGEKANCYVTNVAYGTGLTYADNGWPDSAYVYQNQSKTITWQIYPAIQNHKLVFRILRYDSPFFASDTNTNTDPRNTKYQTKTSERYVLFDWPVRLPTNAEIDWKIVTVPSKANQFRILSAKSDDFMFAHKSATGDEGKRRVLLGRKSFTDHDHIPNADFWTLDCKPGTFTIPSI